MHSALPNMMTSAWAASTALLAFTASASMLDHPSASAPSTSSRVSARRLDATDDLRFHEATFIASHNAHATLAESAGDMLKPIGSNQEDSIIDQLNNDGVRALLLDVAMNEEEKEDPLRLVHAWEAGGLTLDYGGVGSTFGSNLIPFLEDNPDAIISFFVETKNDNGGNVRADILAQLRFVFSSMRVNGLTLKEMTFKYDHELWKDHDNWPTLAEIRQSGQRLFFFSQRSELIDPEFGFMYDRQVLQENDWNGIDDCTPRYMWRSGKVSLSTNDQWTRLFFMNHFCCGSGPGSIGDTIGDDLIGGGNNGWGKLYTRVQQCMANNGGFKPNFIALDWVKQSKEAKEIRDYLNFGGRLGTGQACTDDSHCATSSCNVAGICQCQQCNIDSLGGCPGCDSGQSCFSSDGDELNVCEGNAGDEGATQPNVQEPPTVSGESSSEVTQQQLDPIEGVTNAPTLSPIEASTTFYCGVDYNNAVQNCTNAVKCPLGNDDCPDGKTCFAGIVGCTASPTLSPTSDMPSTRPSSSAPTTSLMGIFAPSLTEPSDTLSSDTLSSETSPAATDNTSFCGLNYYNTQSNCQIAVPCPGPGGNSKCSGLGAQYSCFSNIVCESNTLPIITNQNQNPSPTQQITPPSGTNWASVLGLPASPMGSATSPSTAGATTEASPPTPALRPTEALFDFENGYFCGGNYTDAEQNCYANLPCPTGQPSVCGEGNTCFSGIKCVAPPSMSPTDVFLSEGSPPIGASNGRPNNMPDGMPSTQFTTPAPFDLDLYENTSESGAVALSGKLLMSGYFARFTVAIGLLGILF